MARPGKRAAQGILCQRKVHFRAHRDVQAHLPDVAHDTDDRECRPVWLDRAEAEPEALPDRVVVRPERAGHRFVNDDGERRLGAIMLVEGAPSEQRNPHRPQVLCADGSIVRRLHRHLPRQGYRAPFDREDDRATLERQRQIVHVASGDHIRHRADPLEHLANEGNT